MEDIKKAQQRLVNAIVAMHPKLCMGDTKQEELYVAMHDLISKMAKLNKCGCECSTENSGLDLQHVTAPLLNYSFRDENGEIQHCQVDAKNAEMMIGNMLEQLNKVNRFITEFTSNGR